ncbi:MAG: tetratricopeptide repeat protein [Oceanospirillaceae bacterium]|nr:tetratricopeptide repeat protein [Oceanospirillaceae bacterium]
MKFIRMHTALLSLALLATVARADFDAAGLQERLRQNDPAGAEQFVASELQRLGVPASQALIDNTIGWAYFKMDRLSEAQKYLESALELAEAAHDTRTATLAANNLGVLHFALDDIEKSNFYFSRDYNRTTEVAVEYRQLIAAKETDMLATSALEQGVQQRFEQNFDQAISSYDTALQYQPENAKILEYKGYALFREGKVDKAIEVLVRARQADPSREFVHLNLVKAYCAKGSEADVQATIRQSGLSEEKFSDWYRIDTELRRVCQESPTISKLAPAP